MFTWKSQGECIDSHNQAFWPKTAEKFLTKHGYHELPHTPGLFCHETRQIWFTLVVEDFGIKYVGEEHFCHLIQTLEKHYRITVNKNGEHYLGMTLKSDYRKRIADIFMPGYVKTVLQRFGHSTPKQPFHLPS